MENIQILYSDQYSDNYMVLCIHVYFKIMCLCVYQKKQLDSLNKCIHLLSTTYIEFFFFFNFSYNTDVTITRNALSVMVH